MPMIINGKSIASVLINTSSSSSNSNYIICNNIDEMKALSGVLENSIVRVLGYYENNDGGGAEYLIKDSSKYTSDEILDITLNNGMIAERILSDNKVNVLTLGIKKNSIKTDDVNYAATILKNLLEKYDLLYSIYFPAGTYYIWGIVLDNDLSNSGRTISLIGEHTSNSNAKWNVNILTRGNNFIETNNSQQDFFTVYNISFDSANTDSAGNPLRKSGKCFSSEYANEFNFNLTGVRFANFEYGWYCTKFACGGSYAKDLTLLANKYGIYIPMATHGLRIEGLHCHYNMMACYLPYGGTGNIISGFNYAPGYLAIDKDNYDEYVGIYTQGNNLIIDGMYLEDYLGTQVSPEKSIAIDYNCSGSSKLYINKGLFSNYSALVGEKVLRYRGSYGKDNLILTNCTMNKASIDMFAFEEGKIVTGITIDGRQNTIYGNKMYINEFPPEKKFNASTIRSAESTSVTIDNIKYSCFKISLFAGDIRNKSIVIGAENYSDTNKYLPTVGNWLNQAPSYMEVKGYFKITGYNADGDMKLFIKKSPTEWHVIDFTVTNGEAYIPIDLKYDYYNFNESSSEDFVIYMHMGTAIGESGTLSYSKFTTGTSYELEFIERDAKYYQ